MILHVKNIEGLQLPVQANPDDAGYDIFATSEPEIVGTKIKLLSEDTESWKQTAWSKIDYIQYKTNLFFAPQDEIKYEGVLQSGVITKYHLEGLPRSSVSKKNLLLANSEATLDNPYRGEVCLRFKYVFQPEDYTILNQRIYALLNPENIYKKGDRIAQIKASPNIKIEFKLVDNLDETKRGAGGFGSSN